MSVFNLELLNMQNLEISDEQLMVDAKKGNLDSIGTLYKRYSKRLYNFFLRLTNNRETSADLLQNVFLRIIKYRNSYNPEYLFKTWMYQMARNCLKDQLDNASKNPNSLSNLNVIGNYHEEDSSNLEVAKDEILFRAISCLPNEGKELLVMSKFQGLKYEEISAITGDTVPNIKVKVYRTMIKLKDIYFELEKA